MNQAPFADVPVATEGPWFSTEGLWQSLATPDTLRGALATVAAQARALVSIREAHDAGLIALPAELLAGLEAALAHARPAAAAPIVS